ncbi:VOC family protein [Mesorhizobium sp. AaZ16]|uniref:VOC family protein n=1 Tax=Mesorhizobium sp. AaZ16 TaxID=3402289 RepID=UPI00374E8CAF
MTKPPRPIDHLVLPTADLAAARTRLSALGFTVAPDGVHPFGTENACVYFAGGTFLEPLAVRDGATADEAIAGGNVFVARDRMFRQANGDEGFSAVVFGTDDAAADHRDFVKAGVSAGDVLDFSRPFLDASGKTATVSFKLAFAAESDARDPFFFTCERLNSPNVDRAGLQRHANGASRLSAVVASSESPERHAGFLASLARSGVVSRGDSTFDVDLPNGRLCIGPTASLAREFGAEGCAGGSGLRLAAILFGVDDLAATGTLLRSNSIEFSTIGGRLVVPPAPGQGAAFAFEENS